MNDFEKSGIHNAGKGKMFLERILEFSANITNMHISRSTLRVCSD